MVSECVVDLYIICSVNAGIRNRKNVHVYIMHEARTLWVHSNRIK